MIIETHPNDGGKLSVINMNQLPFTALRSFYITDVPKDKTLGLHAHYETEQFLVCLQGAVMVVLFDGIKHTRSMLLKNDTLYIPKMIWGAQKYMTDDTILLVMCSTPYDPDDYIHDKEQYKDMICQQ